MGSLKEICSGLPLNPLPPKQGKLDTLVPHAPNRTPNLSAHEEKVWVNLFVFPFILIELMKQISGFSVIVKHLFV